MKRIASALAVTAATAALVVGFTGIAPQQAQASVTYPAKISFDGGVRWEGCETYKDAFELAARYDNSIIQITGEDATHSGATYIDNNVTLDLHRHLFKNAHFVVKGTGSLSIIDTAPADTCTEEEPVYNADRGRLEGTSYVFSVKDSAKLTINGGEYYGTVELLYTEGNSSVTVSNAILSADNSGITPTGYSKVVFNNSTISALESVVGAVSTSTTINNCKIEKVNCPFGNTVVNSGTIGYICTPNTGSLTINGGTINQVVASSSGKCTINGGTIGGLIVCHDSQCTINGGTFKGTDSSTGTYTLYTHTFRGKLQIKGGTFYSHDPNNAFLALNDSSDGTSDMLTTGGMLAPGYAYYKVNSNGSKTLITTATALAKSSVRTYGRDGSFGLNKPNGLPAGTYVVAKCTHQLVGKKCGACGERIFVAGSSTTKASYKIVSSTSVSYIDCKVNGSKATVPSTVKIKGKAFKVTSIASKAFCSKKVKSVTVGKNVAKIGKQAFYKCSKLKTVTFKTTKLKSSKVGSKAFGKTPKTMTVKCGKKAESYKSWLAKKGVSKKAKIKK